MLKLLLLVSVLATAAWAQEGITCTTTSQISTSHRHRSPTASIVVRIPGTWTVTGGDFSESAFFYRTAFRVHNVSGSVPIVPDDSSFLPTSALGVQTLVLTTKYPVALVGATKLTYNRLSFQSVNFVFNGTQVDKLELTCPPSRLTTVYGGVIAGGKIILMASKPVKRCESNTSSLIPASWFSYSAHTCTQGLSNCLSFARGSLCLESHLTPVDARRTHFYCTMSANISSDMATLDYTLQEGVLCDAADNHTVSHRGNAGSASFVRVTQGLLTGASSTAISLPNLIDNGHDEVVVDLQYPVDYTNFTAVKNALTVAHGSALFLERCIPIRQGTPSIIAFKCVNNFVPWARTTFTWNMIGNQFNHRFGAVHSQQATFPHDDELDAGIEGTFVFNYKITEAYRLSANQLLIRMSHPALVLPDKDNIKVYQSAVYNVSNITRATPSSFYANFDTSNALPKSDHLKVYHFPADPIEANAPMLFSEAVSVENGPPDDSEDITFADLDDPWKAAAYIGLATSAIVALAILYYGYHNCAPANRGYTRAKS